jgi:type II secretory pathway pseudopilin PulG
MKKQMVLSTVAAVGALSVLLSFPVRQASAQTVFQAAGPDGASIQSTVDAYRAALGDPNNGNTAQSALTDPTKGRREINWDGGGANETTDVPATPFNVFRNTRGAQFTTPGTGLSQAPPSGGPQGGLATLFNNPTYGDIFNTFSDKRLFTPVGSRFTEGLFFVPGTNGGVPAAVTGFGAVFTDVDEPDELHETRSREHATKIEYFDADGNRLFTGFVPASPGDGSLSFFGIVFDDPLIARVRITTGESRPGRNDDKKDIVMMDDFIYGEPQPLP